MQNEELTRAAQSVPLIEVLDEAPAGAKRFAGPYYPDESDKLKGMLQQLRNRANYLVAPGLDSLIYIYRRAA